MNTGQIMLILGAFAMLAVLALGLNRTLIGSVVLGIEMEATLNSLSIGQSMMDEVMQRNFDQKTINKVAYSYSDLTPAESLGPESGEEITGIDSAYTLSGTFHDFQSKSMFNDVDDYNLYHRVVVDPLLGKFDVFDSIKYVSEYVPSRDTVAATFYKKIVVVVRHSNLPRATDTSSAPQPVILRDLAIYRQYF